MKQMPVFFHSRQLAHKPVYEWAMGERLEHPETTYRAENIYNALSADSSAFVIREPQPISEAVLKRAHNPRLITLFQKAREIQEGTTFYPSVFPKRHQTRANPADVHQAGYFCYDSGTPLNSTTWEAAAWSASCANDAAKLVESGQATASYALCRPPGHHASRDLFGGYCYFNNAAIIAKRARAKCRVAILDIDFHHGNGTQDIFYRDNQVLFLSIHGDPKDFYPFFSGYAHEEGSGRGKGFTLNLPIPRGCDGQEYLKLLSRKILPTIRAFDPGMLILSAGFDTYEKDPIGAFALKTRDFHVVGELLGKLGLPTVILQEGGYCVNELGLNVATFLRGFSEGQIMRFGARGRAGRSAGRPRS